ncbi:MAG: ATP-binding protein [Acidimicrobiia bacterium]|nr:ATP-binding protein [Acidimicrobiia bacterium]MDH4306084.1 ATP-binding protein [Acidimicrobiia bacterium]MDH5293287.1 ATP-binding protein [Acidimicrobiia bacterium]
MSLHHSAASPTETCSGWTEGHSSWGLSTRPASATLLESARFGSSRSAHGERSSDGRRDRQWVTDPESHREAIFEAFERSPDRTYGGTSIGLGLSVARQLARLMGGDLTYDHTGFESVFRLTLPAAG